jgi:5-hydroxyisourate hydrolase-like protein (transthyretin family)
MFTFVAARKSVSTTRTLVSALAALVVGALLALGLSSPAFATPSTGTFNLTLQTYSDHTVESDPGAPVEGATLDLYHYVSADQDWEQLDSVQTNSAGQLDSPVTGLVVGDKYAVYVDATQATDANNSQPVTDSNGWLVQQGELMSSDFDGNASDGPDAVTYFVATAGATTPIADLLPGITLTGNILAPASVGVSSTDASEVDFYRQTTGIDGLTQFDRYTSVHPSGADSYSVSDLAPGSYDVEVRQNSQPSWAALAFNLAQSTFATATPVELSYGPPATQDVQFISGATISGTVTLDPALDPSDGTVAYVQAFPLNSLNETENYNDDAPQAPVDPNTGAYSLSVAPGKYAVEFEPDAAATGGLYYPTWFNDASSSFVSTPVTLGTGDAAPSVDGTIGEGLTVQGNVTSAEDGNLDGITVNLLSEDGFPTLSATTDASGHYSITAQPDVYNLQFVDPTGRYPDRYFTGSDDGSPNIGLASTITQSTGSVTDDFVYDNYSTLTVHVANKAGTSLAGVQVSAQAMAHGSAVPNADPIDGTALTGHPGTYLLPSLQQDQAYALHFYPSPSAAGGTYSQFYGGSIDAGASDLYTPMDSSSSLDVTLASSAAVSGIVSTTAGKGIKGVGVDLYSFDGTSWNDLESTATSSTGAYSFPNLATGSYTVQFSPANNSGYIGTFAGGVADAAGATHVYVSPGKPAVISQHLAVGGSITGVIAGPGDAPKLSDIEVDPIVLTGAPGNFTAATPYYSTYAESTTGGKFSLMGLPTGYYALSFYDFSGTYGDSYVNPVVNPLSPPAIYHVTAGKATAVPGTIDLPLLSSQATAVVNGSLDTSSLTEAFESAAGIVDISDASGDFLTSIGINIDGSFTTNLVPGDYNYSMTVFDPQNPQNRFATEQGPFTVTAGGNSLQIPVVAAAPLQFTTDPAITDTSDPRVGTTYQLNNVTWNEAGATATYQWMRGDVPIYGATATSYTSQGADVGADLELRVTVSSANVVLVPSFTEVDETIVRYATAASQVAPSDGLSNTDPPSTSADVTSRATVGQVVRANPGDWNDIPGANYLYQWILDGTSTVLGTGPSFTPTAAEADATDSVRLSVTASKLGYTTPAPVSDPDSFIILPLTAPTVKIAPKITSKLVAGNTVYTVTPGTWSVAGTTPSYQWNETGISGSVSTTNSFTFTPSDENADDAITVTVLASRSGYSPGQAMAVARKSDFGVTVNGDTPTQDSVVGAVNDYSTLVPVGSILSLSSPTYVFLNDNSAPTTLTYQWQRINPTTLRAANIVGATKSTYTVSAADVGSRLFVLIYASSATHSPASYAEIGGTAELRQDLVNSPATVSPASTNTNAPLTKITDTVGPWGSTTAVTDSYQWFICATDCSSFAVGTTASGYTPIAKATMNSYTPTLAQKNDSIVLRVTGSKSTYASAVVYGPITTIGDGATITALNSPSVASGLTSGKATFGVKLTAKPMTVDVPAVKATYSWSLSTDGGANWTAVHGTNGLSTYTPILTDFTSGVQTVIRVIETATKTNYAPALGSSANYPLVGITAVPTVKPVITTTSATWTATPGTWPTVGGSGDVTYQWIVDNGSVGNSTNQFDRTTVTAVNYVVLDIEYSGGAAYKPSFFVVIFQKGAAPAWTAPTISGIPVFGNTLSAPTVAADAFQFPSVNTSASLSYQWYSGTAAIAKATASTFTPSTAYINKMISVKITSTSQDYATASHLTAGVLFAAAAAQHGTPTLSYAGALHPGSTVGVMLDGYTLAGLTHSYQWRVSTDDVTWTNIAGATKSTYLVPASLLGDHLEAIVGTSKAGYLSASDPTDDQLVVEPTVLQPTTAPTLAGSGAIGALLTVNPGVWNVVGTTFTYAWSRDGISIPGVTGSTYAPTSDELGEVISVQITAHAAGYYPVTASPSSISVTTGAAPTNVTKPKITGSMIAGSTLTASPGVWSLDGVTLGYQWYVGTAVATPIDGATGSTWTVDEALHGKPVFVVVTATRDGYALASAASSSTSVVV